MKIAPARYLMSLLIVLLATLMGWLAQSLLPSRDLTMFYLLAVVIAALRYGKGPAIMASISSVMIFDFLFVTPRFSLYAIHVEDWIMLAGFLTVGLLISTLTAQTREHDRVMGLMREKEKLQTILLNAISHDLRTPLVSITGALSSLLHDPHLDEKTGRDLIENAYQDSTRLNALVGNLLDMTRVESGALMLSPKPCDISDLIGTALQQFPKERLVQRRISVFTKDIPEVALDFTFMMKVLVNIIDNALKYSPEDSPVTVNAKVVSNQLYIEVIDAGQGIPEKDLRRVFDKFYRAEESQKVAGTGLGLAIAKGIVEAHKGKIWAEKQPHGTKIVIALPFKQDH